jgi:hypothetical protein
LDTRSAHAVVQRIDPISIDLSLFDTHLNSVASGLQLRKDPE